MSSLSAMLERLVPTALRPPARRAVRRTRFSIRRATASQRSLPDFIIAGAMKSGTSSLYLHLCAHPAILPSSVKEVHFFDVNPHRGEDWYRAHFPLTRHKKPGTLTGEASPYYLFDPQVPERIAALLPDVKLIVMLRNPTDRAISHYYHAVRSGHEDLPLAEALEREEERMHGSAADAHRVQRLVWNSYKSRGLYAQQLERYLAHFPRERMWILPSESFFGAPHAWLRTAFEFLGVDPDFTPDALPRANPGINREPVDPGVRASLDAYFAPHNEALRRMLDARFDW